MTYCLFGGTFNPPHIAHLRLARAAINELSLGKLVFMPAPNPPHKISSDYIAFEHRYKMLQLMTAAEPDMQVSDFENSRTGKSYTVDTLKIFREKYNLEPDQLYFLMGSDSLEQLHTWRKPEELLQQAQLLVYQRPGFKPENVRSEFLSKARFIAAPPIDISATEIRYKLASGEDVSAWLTKPVLAYIRRNNLYNRIN